MSPGKIVILIPVFNDWQALRELMAEFETLLTEHSRPLFHLLLVNDGSWEAAPAKITGGFSSTILNLTHNIGHQKAISIGLSYVHHHLACSQVLVMDADGDDRPRDALRLIEAAQHHSGKIVVGARTKRQDGSWKNAAYKIYLFLFRILTGKTIRFGNFCVLPFSVVQRLIYKGDIWLHVPGGIIKSQLPYISINTEKGTRYTGDSKMNFISLVYHGISALAAFIDVVAIRVLIASGVAIGVSILGLVAILLIRLTTQWAIPGWASTLASSIIIIILLSFLIALFLVFTFLTAQSYRKFIPALHYKEFIGSIESPQP